jgi:hypothetical protein
MRNGKDMVGREPRIVGEMSGEALEMMSSRKGQYAWTYAASRGTQLYSPMSEASYDLSGRS